MKGRSLNWTDQERDVIRQHYPVMSARDVSERYLPHRSAKQIGEQACALGVRRRTRTHSRRHPSHGYDPTPIEITVATIAVRAKRLAERRAMTRLVDERFLDAV